MAIITPSELFSNIKGSIGSTTFSTNRAGLIAKRKTLGKRNYTTKQANVIKIQSFIVGQWQNLTLAQQLLWNDYADLYPQIDRFGVTKNLSGFNWFTHMNNLKYVYDSIILEEPPARVSAQIIPEFDLLISNSSVEVIPSETINFAEDLLYIFITLPNQLTRNTNRGKFRLVKVIDSPNFSSLDITADYESTFNIDWSNLSANGQFKIQCCMYSVNKISWMNSVQLCVANGLNEIIFDDLIAENNDDLIAENNDDLIIE